MSLLESAMVKCTIIDKVTAPDGRGGTTMIWQDGAEFDAAIAFNSSMEARAAEKAGVTSLYTVTTRKGVNLEFHTVFRREADGKIFRVTSDGSDNKTPPTAGLNMRNVNAEEFKLTNG